MKLNEYQALLTPQVLLVPYSEYHVPTYHKWMQNPTLQTLTASEPLTLEEEYNMQRSWRTDADKLTFIVCYPPSSSTSSVCETILPGHHDVPTQMIGDVNLFLTPSHLDLSDEAPDFRLTHPTTQQVLESRKKHALVGEIEIMIAEPSAQGKGLGKEVLLGFMWYILKEMNEIIREYSDGNRSGGVEEENSGWCVQYMRVKIDKDNVRSIRLFEGVGFVKVTEEANCFGEVELRLPISEEILREVEGRMEGMPRVLGYSHK